MKKLITILAALAILASGTANAQVAEKLTAHRLDRPWTFSSFVAPSGCVSTSVPFFGSDLRLTCDGGLTYDAQVGGLQEVGRAVANADANSLINSDVSAPEWMYDDTSAFIASVAKSTAGVIVNRELATAQLYYYRGIRAWVAPPGVTSATFTVRARRVTDDATAYIRMAIADATGAALAPDNTTIYSVGADFTDYSVSATVVPGTSYTAIFFARHIGMAAGATQRFEVASARLTPGVGTGVFAASFVRYAVTPALAGNSYGWAWNVSRRTYDQSTFATVSLSTTASSVAIEYSSDVYTTSAGSAKIGYQETGQPAAALAVAGQQIPKISEITFAGSRDITIWGGLQTKPASSVLGTRLVAVYVPAGASVAFRRAPASIVVYGDSITAGGNATNPPTEAWPVLLRPYMSGRVAVDGWGYRSLYDDATDATARTAFARRLVSFGAHRYWFTIGTNDYGLNKWSAASFGTAYAALLDELKRQDPLAVIYCQTPITRTTETANGSGSTLSDYRAQIRSAAAARWPWAVAVDGQSFMTTSSLDDGVHPTTAGHVLYADAVRSVLGM